MDELVLNSGWPVATSVEMVSSATTAPLPLS